MCPGQALANDNLIINKFSIYTELATGFYAGSYTFKVTGTIPSGTTASITVNLVITAPSISNLPYLYLIEYVCININNLQ